MALTYGGADEKTCRTCGGVPVDLLLPEVEMCLGVCTQTHKEGPFALNDILPSTGQTINYTNNPCWLTVFLNCFLVVLK